MPKSSCLAVSPVFDTADHYFGGVKEPRMRLSQIVERL